MTDRIKRHRRTDHPVRKIGEGVYQIDEFGAAFCYLIVGDKKALLIDTGCGYGDLAGCIRRITDLPLLVAATHGHVDHIGGKSQFPEIYLHRADFGLEKFMSFAAARLCFFTMQKDLKKKGFGLWDALSGGRYRTRFIAMDHNTVFDLGGKTVRVIHTPGHSRGSCAFLLMEERILFTGDNMDRHLWLFLPGSTTVREWIKGAKRLRRLAVHCTVYGGHDRQPFALADMDAVIETGRRLEACRKKEKKGFPGKRAYPDQRGEVYILYRRGRI